MTVTITQDDIDHGRRFDCQECPVALAVARAIGVEGGVEAHHDCIRFFSSWVRTPTEASDFMQRFDDRLPVQPISFDLPEIGEWM